MNLWTKLPSRRKNSRIITNYPNTGLRKWLNISTYCRQKEDLRALRKDTMQKEERLCFIWDCSMSMGLELKKAPKELSTIFWMLQIFRIHLPKIKLVIATLVVTLCQSIESLPLDATLSHNLWGIQMQWST